MLIPSDNMVMQNDAKKIDIALSFSHPFEGIGMKLVKPESFFVVKDGKREALLNNLKEIKVMDQKGWKAKFQIKRPGIYS